MGLSGQKAFGQRTTWFTVVLALAVPLVAVACLWDYDTIKMERYRFPETLELITGKFLRHSPEFYKWRIKNRIYRLEKEPSNLNLLDDLAVAYDKTGQHELAIATAQRAEKLQPNRYETVANLGTFYLHSGKFAEGITHIERALKINPEAHFGREKYQKLLVEYLLQRRENGPLNLPLSTVCFRDAPIATTKQPIPVSPLPGEIAVTDTFADFLVSLEAAPSTENDEEQPNIRRGLDADTAAAALKGVLGMMKFGKYDSPILLETLGVLLARGEENNKSDGKLLAARAFLKASYEVAEGPARTAYRCMAAHALHMQVPESNQNRQINLAEVEAEFQKELVEARTWYSKLQTSEWGWIRDSQDPEAEFDKLYDTPPEVSGMDVPDPLTQAQKEAYVFAYFLVPCMLLIISIPFIGAWLRRRK